MASVGLWEIPKVVDSTTKGQRPKGSSINHQGYMCVFPVTPQEPWVNLSVAHLRRSLPCVERLPQQDARGGPSQPA